MDSTVRATTTTTSNFANCPAPTGLPAPPAPAPSPALHIAAAYLCRVIKWLKAFAAERGLAWVEDKAGNLVIKRPGSGGGEAAPPVVIQGGCRG